MKLTLATLLLAAALTLTGCQATPTTTTSQINQGAVSEKKAPNRDGINDAPILKCGSILTKSGKPCKNRVKEDSFCRLHAKREAETGATKAEFLQ